MKWFWKKIDLNFGKCFSTNYCGICSWKNYFYYLNYEVSAICGTNNCFGQFFTITLKNQKSFRKD